MLIFVDVTVIDAIKGDGCISPEDVIAAVKPTTCLITIMLANNETGIVQVIYLYCHRLSFMDVCLYVKISVLRVD
jgi:selenocysteine lyase